MPTALERAQGCLTGLAIGDALGTTLEFTQPGSFTPISDLVGGGPFNLSPGQWTDDTSMALCLAESLLECGECNLADQITRYIRWWKHGHFSSTGTCFDIGNTVRSALSSFLKHHNPIAGTSDPWSAGNGSIMRLAPIPLFFKQASDAIHFAAESSRTTHQAAACLDACRYLSAIVWGLLHGATKEEVTSACYHPGQEPWNDLHPSIAEITTGSFKAKNPPQIRGNGYVVQSLEAALWAFHRSTNFQEGALLAVNLGEDADTTGAIYGQIAGAHYGLRGIPDQWLKQLHQRALILDFAQQLHTYSPHSS